jgi:hypothetical protein
MAQSPDEAEYDTMPRAAIATGLVDFVLPARELGARIGGAPGQRPARTASPRKRRGAGGRRGAAPAQDPLPAPGAHRPRLQRLQEEHRPAPDRAADPGDGERRPGGLPGPAPGERLRGGRAAQGPAHQRHELLPGPGRVRDSGEDGGARPLRGRRDRQVRVWVAGCATGEEAYSVAMLLTEHADTLADPPSFQIFATDPDEDAIAFARAGLYPDAIATDLGEERVRRFFTREGPYLRVQGAARADPVLAPQPAERSAVLAPRPHQLPQPPHLPRGWASGAPVRHLPIRAPPGRLPLPGRVRNRRRAPGVQRIGQRAPDLPARPRPGREGPGGHPRAPATHRVGAGAGSLAPRGDHGPRRGRRGDAPAGPRGPRSAHPPGGPGPHHRPRVREREPIPPLHRRRPIGQPAEYRPARAARRAPVGPVPRPGPGVARLEPGRAGGDRRRAAPRPDARRPRR